jgi:hypothetical protein
MSSLGRVVVLVAAVLLGLFAGVLAVGFGVFLGRSWSIDAGTRDVAGAVITGGLLSACLYALFHSLVQLRRRLNGELESEVL